MKAEIKLTELAVEDVETVKEVLVEATGEKKTRLKEKPLKNLPLMSKARALPSKVKRL